MEQGCLEELYVHVTDDGRPVIDSDSWERKNLAEIPNQESNGTECGVMVLGYIKEMLVRSLVLDSP
jgi:Ulp1 family protease